MTDDKVILFEGLSALDIPPERVIREAEKMELNRVIIIGDTDEELYLATSIGKTADIVFLLEQAKFRILRGDYKETFEGFEEDEAD